MKKCKFCGKEFLDGRKLGGHQTWCKYNPNISLTKTKLSKLSSNKKLSNETKQKISISRKQYLLENPDKVPYKLNNKHKISYPERYFMRLLKGFIFQYKIPGTLYEADFANPKLKIDIEIDGEQHYVDSKIISHDKERNKKLESLGWKTIRIRWSLFKKLELEKRKEIVSDLLKYKDDTMEKLIIYSEIRDEEKRKEKERLRILHREKKIKELDLKKSERILLKKNKEEEKRKEKEEWINNRKEIILSSSINFQKFGWVKKVALLFNISPQKGSQFIKKYMPDFYKTCYVRN